MTKDNYQRRYQLVFHKKRVSKLS